MRRFSRFFVTSALSLALVAPAIAIDKAIIVMDASGSMWGQIEGKTKIEIARETLGDVVGSFPDDLELGLIAYGHREKGVCTDIEQIVAPAAGNRDAITGAVNKLNPKGKTPLSDAVTQAAESLKYTEDKATVILITDGIETCNADPCAVATALESRGVDFTAHVVGFGLSKEEGRQVACLAENTGGKFIEAKDAGELTEALTQVAVAAPPPPPKPEPKPEPVSAEDNVTFTAVFSEDGEAIDHNGRYDFYPMEGEKPAKKAVVGGYEDNFTVTLEPGRYLLRYKVNRVEAETIVDVKASEKIERDLILNAGYVDFTVALSDDGEPIKMGSFNLKIADTNDTTYNEMKQIVPAGKGVLITKVGRAAVEHEVEIAAGERLSKTFVNPAGRFAATATYTEGGEIVDSSPSFQIVGAKKSLSGKRKNIETQYNKADTMLAPGDYVVIAKAGRASVEMPFSVEANSLTELVVPLNAGIAAFTAPNARSITIFEAKKNIEGKRKRLDTSYGPENQITLSDGEYVAVVDYEADKAAIEKAFKVTAGERVELTIE